MTARDLIKGSMRLIGVLASGEQPSASEAADALASLNSLIDSWRTKRLLVYSVLPETFSLVAGKKKYTMGPGGDFDTVRPVRVELAKFIYSQIGTPGPGPLHLSLEIINVDQYNAFIVPDTQSPIPMWVYIDDAFPLRNVYFYTVPNMVNSVELFTWKQLTGFPNLDADISLPPGYEKALRYALAMELAPEYGTSPSDVVVSTAATARADVMSSNNTYVPLLQADAALIANKGGFNYLTGE